MFAPALGKHIFLLRLQHREPLDLLQVAGKPRFARNDGQRRSHVFLWLIGDRFLASPSALGPVRRIVVEQAWPKKGRAYTLIRRRYEIVSPALPHEKGGQAGWLVMH